MKKVFVSLIALLVLAVSAYSMDLPHSRHVADTGPAFELSLPAFAGVPVIAAAPTASWLNASYLRSDQIMSIGITASQRGLERDIYATKHDYAIGNRARAVTRGRRCWRV